MRQNRIRFKNPSRLQPQRFKSPANQKAILISIDGEPCLATPALLFAVVSRGKILEAHVRHVQLYEHLALEFWAGQPDFGTCAKN